MHSTSLRRHRSLNVWLAVGLTALVAVGFWLRWRFIHDVSPDVDEFTTLWAARRIVETGTPSLPSGVIYTRGILNMYITALFIAVGGLTYVVGRLPSVLFGVASIAAVLLVGRREWDSRVGWLAALALVLIPETIKWDGRARFYAQLVFFALLTIWSAFQIARLGQEQRADERTVWRAHLLFALCFVLSLFSQEETILLYPALALGLLWWQGWRYFFQPAAIVAHGLCVGAMALRYVFEQVAQPGYFAEMQVHKSYFNFSIDWLRNWYAIDRLFLPLLPPAWALLVPLALVVVGVQLYRVQGQPDRLARFHQATLFFFLQFLVVGLILVLVVGDSWHDKRFGLMIQPAWLLTGAAGAIWLVDLVGKHRYWRYLTTFLLTLLVIWPLWPMAQNVLARRGEGYDAVFAYVAAHRQPADQVMTPQPPACVVVLGEPCDYFARERGYEPYVIEQDGILVDRWSGAPLLASAEQLEAVIKSAPRVWLVTDRERLAKRYNGDFLRTVVEQFDAVFEERDVLALVAEGWQEPPAYTVQEAPTKPVTLDKMSLVGWERTTPTPGEYLRTMLFWQLSGAIDYPVNTSLQLVSADGTRITQADGAPTDGVIATEDYPRMPLPDYKVMLLPADLAPGRYRLEVIAYEVYTHSPLADPIAVDWFTLGPPPATPTQVLDTSWQNGIALQGHDDLPATLAPQASFVLRLVWTTDAAVSDDYTAFVHLIGPDGNIVAQNDRQPLDGFYPTSAWAVSDPVEDFYGLTLPATLLPGEYRLLVGWYLPATGERLRLADGSDAAEIARWVVP